MFLEKYLKKIYCDIVYSNYNHNYLMQLDEKNFEKVYKVLEKYNLRCLDDIIMKYIEIFEYDPIIVDKAMYSLISILGKNYVDIINTNLIIMDKLIESIQNIIFKEFEEE